MKRPKIDNSALAIGLPKRVRDKEHLEFIASLPCCRTGQDGCDAAHISHENGKGMSCKVGDDNAVRLTRTEHTLQHAIGEQSYWGQDLERAKRLAKDLYANTGNYPKCRMLVILFYQGK